MLVHAFISPFHKGQAGKTCTSGSIQYQEDKWSVRGRDRGASSSPLCGPIHSYDKKRHCADAGICSPLEVVTQGVLRRCSSSSSSSFLTMNGSESAVAPSGVGRSRSTSWRHWTQENKGITRRSSEGLKARKPSRLATMTPRLPDYPVNDKTPHKGSLYPPPAAGNNRC